MFLWLCTRRWLAVLCLGMVFVACGKDKSAGITAASSALAPSDTSVTAAYITAPNASALAAISTGLTLDASASRGANGKSIREYRWKNLDFPASQAPFAVGQSVVSSKSTYRLKINPALLHYGVYHFQLVVVDESGGQSQPFLFEFNFIDNLKPIADMIAPSFVEAGHSFRLNAVNSVDAPPGYITAYEFSFLHCKDAIFPDGSRTKYRTKNPNIMIDNAPGTLMGPGSCTIQLVAEDEAGNDSLPITAIVILRDSTPPVARIDGPRQLQKNQWLILNASKSFDIAPGEVVQYQWTNLSLKSAAGFPVGAEVSTTQPVLSIQPSANGFEGGDAQIQLVVFDEAGNPSDPVIFQVQVL